MESHIPLTITREGGEEEEEAAAVAAEVAWLSERWQEKSLQLIKEVSQASDPEWSGRTEGSMLEEVEGVEEAHVARLVVAPVEWVMEVATVERSVAIGPPPKIGSN